MKIFGAVVIIAVFCTAIVLTAHTCYFSSAKHPALDCAERGGVWRDFPEGRCVSIDFQPESR